jgi:hypothetical protein
MDFSCRHGIRNYIFNTHNQILRRNNFDAIFLSNVSVYMVKMAGNIGY